jgi:hypothetical protein
MSRTTLRLGEESRAHIGAAKAKMEERYADFVAEADARFAKIVGTGKTIRWADMRRYVTERANGQPSAHPSAGAGSLKLGR